MYNKNKIKNNNQKIIIHIFCIYTLYVLVY